MRAIGVISGTSMDGIDAAFVETDGDGHVKPGPGRTYPYDPVLRQALLDVIAAPERAEHQPLPVYEAAVTDAHADAARRLMTDFGIDPASIDLVGLHGQTVFHRPERRFTRQLLDGPRAARRLGVDVVHRFRHADIAAGGQGAPLAPLYHRALASGLDGPVMILNLGGVANVTWIDGDRVIAFDCGPASALLDDFVSRRTGLPFDEDGRLSASGEPDRALLAALLSNPFFDRAPPKSLDRQDFHRRASAVDALSDADGAATLSAFTIDATARALEHVPRLPVRWLVCGGGRLNGHFMARLRARLGVPVEPVETLGWNGDFLEAECFAYLAVRSVRGLPLSLPTTTGAPEPMTGGELARADRRTLTKT
jgi:anhydro-N-acetylmuramic acid kinase